MKKSTERLTQRFARLGGPETQTSGDFANTIKIEKVAASKGKNSLSRLLDFEKISAMAQREKEATTQYLCESLLHNLHDQSDKLAGMEPEDLDRLLQNTVELLGVSVVPEVATRNFNKATSIRHSRTRAPSNGGVASPDDNSLDAGPSPSDSGTGQQEASAEATTSAGATHQKQPSIRLAINANGSVTEIDAQTN